jgi:protein-S-isoprenylcysteine O-methyltransferase Ste14
MIAVRVVVWIIIVLVHGSVTILFPYLLLRANIQLLSGELGVFRLLGVLPILLGALVVLRSVWDLTVTGKGTPAPFDPPREFVVKSLYRFVRNPMYLGDLLVLVGESLLFESAILLIYALLMLCVFHLFVVLHEEPTLKRRFGESYARYRKAIPRWIPTRSAYK